MARVTLEELRKRERSALGLLPHARDLTAFMATPAGAALRRELEVLVWTDPLSDSVEGTYFKLGMQALAKRLLRLDLNDREATG